MAEERNEEVEQSQQKEEDEEDDERNEEEEEEKQSKQKEEDEKEEGKTEAEESDVDEGSNVEIEQENGDREGNDGNFNESQLDDNLIEKENKMFEEREKDYATSEEIIHNVHEMHNKVAQRENVSDLEVNEKKKESTDDDAVKNNALDVACKTGFKVISSLEDNVKGKSLNALVLELQKEANKVDKSMKMLSRPESITEEKPEDTDENTRTMKIDEGTSMSENESSPPSPSLLESTESDEKEKSEEIADATEESIIIPDSEEEESEKETLPEEANPLKEKSTPAKEDPARVEVKTLETNSNTTVIVGVSEDSLHEKSAPSQTEVDPGREAEAPGTNPDRGTAEAAEEPVPDYYTLLCLHVETLKISNSPDISLTQVGVTTALNNSGHTKEELLLPVHPAELATTLTSYRLEGDLLRALHMTEAAGGQLEFRAAFTTREEGEEPLPCLQEAAALSRLAAFLARFEQVVLLTIDSADAALVLAKLARAPGGGAAVARVARVATWGSTLEACWSLLGPRYDRRQDLEDFYTAHCGEVSGYVSALHVANFLRKAVKRLCLHYFRTPAALGQPNKLVARNTFIRALSQAAGVVVEEPGRGPAVSSRIGMEAMDTVDLSSGSEVYSPEVLEVQRVKRKVRHVVEELQRGEAVLLERVE